MKVAYTSSFVPPEWIAAHGFTPVRVRPTSEPVARAGACPFAEAFLGEAADGCAAVVYATTSAPREDRFIGIFYFLWHNRGFDRLPNDISKILPLARGNRRVARIAARRHHRQHQGGIVDSARYWSGVGERSYLRWQWVVRYTAISRFDPEYTAKRSRNTDRAGGVRPLVQMPHVRCTGGCCTATRPARRTIQIPRISRYAG